MVTITLEGVQPNLALSVLPKGLCIHQFIIQHDGRTHDIVIGSQKPEDMSQPQHKYQNVIIGRYANRIPVQTYELEKDGIKSTFTPQPNEHPKVSLHGGPVGWDQAEWIPLTTGDLELFSSQEKEQIDKIVSDSVTTFYHISPSGDQGFPGQVRTEVLFALLPALAAKGGPITTDKEIVLGSLAIIYRAKLLGSEKVVTPINLTQHWGFNLDASLLSHARQPMTDVKDHVLTINGDHHIELDGLALSTGNLLPVANSPEHIHNAKPIGEHFTQSGYDSFYVFREEPVASDPIHLPESSLPKLNVFEELLRPFELDSKESLEPLVQLASEKSGIRLLFDSNQPGVQFYSANFATGAGSRKRIHGGTGSLEGNDGYTPGSAAFLEFHEHLAAWMHPSATKETDTLLVSGEIYNNFVHVRVVARLPDPEKSQD